jgi:hypothetical protein
MSARERESGELPSPNLSLFNRKVGQGHFVSMGELLNGWIVGLSGCVLPFGVLLLVIDLVLRKSDPGRRPAVP